MASKQVIILIVIFSTLLVGLFGQSGKVPAWYGNVDREYPQEQFLAFVGAGPNLAAARNDGTVQMARYFGFKVEVFSEAKTLLNETSLKTDISNSLSQSVQITIDQQLFAVRYSDPYEHGPETSVVVYIKLKELSENLKRTIVQIGESLNELLAGIDTTDNGLIKLARAATATILAERMEPFIKKLELFAPDMADELRIKYQPSATQDRWLTVRHAQRFNVQIKNDQDSRQSNFLKSKLSTLGFEHDSKGNLPIKGNIQYKDIAVSNDFKTIEWTYSLSVFDSKGNELFSRQKTSRNSGSSKSAAMTVIQIQLEKFTSQEFLMALQEYLAGKVSID